jgi:predicted TIM-barrel fold metal-dependent hydrolase
MIFKIKIKDKKTGEEDYVIMGDSYKSFKDHFINIISHWTKKWHYQDDSQHSKCFGRTINKEILEIWQSDENFVSFGGLKMAYEENYDKEVEQHNRNSRREVTCKYLKDIKWELQSQDFIRLLLKENRVISEEELKALQGGGGNSSQP